VAFRDVRATIETRTAARNRPLGELAWRGTNTGALTWW
jgi:hypothetical protein